jgi:uncharacterized membrane protein YeaQ/YmgE (transglycosylase-associated protein family)
MSIENILVFILVGAVAGFVGQLIVKGKRLALIPTIIIGILGGLLGGWLFGLVGVSIGGGILSDIITASIGAIIVLFLLRMFKR